MILFSMIKVHVHPFSPIYIFQFYEVTFSYTAYQSHEINPNNVLVFQKRFTS